MRVRDNQKSQPLEAEVYMLEGITAAENERLQRTANTLERQMFRRRIKDPAKTMADLRSALRAAGLVCVRLKWSGSSSLLFDAEAGRKFKPVLRGTTFVSADEVLCGCVSRAVRTVGLKLGVEDICVHADGKRVKGSVSAVPFAAMSAALDRMVHGRRGHRQAKATRAKKLLESEPDKIARWCAKVRAAGPKAKFMLSPLVDLDYSKLQPELIKLVDATLDFVVLGQERGASPKAYSRAKTERSSR